LFYGLGLWAGSIVRGKEYVFTRDFNALLSKSLQFKQALNNIRRITYEGGYGLRTYVSSGSISVGTATTLTTLTNLWELMAGGLRALQT